MLLAFRSNKIRDLFKVKLYTIRSKNWKERERYPDRLKWSKIYHKITTQSDSWMCVWILKRMNKSKIKCFYFSAIHLLEPHMKRKVNADRHLFFCLRMQLRDVTKTNRTLAKLKGFFVCLLFMIWVWKNENIRLVPSLQSNQCEWSDIHQKMTTNSDFMRQYHLLTSPISFEIIPNTCPRIR